MTAPRGWGWLAHPAAAEAAMWLSTLALFGGLYWLAVYVGNQHAMR